MPVYRGPDGKIIEERSGRINKTSGAGQSVGANPSNAIDEPTRKVSSRPAPPDRTDAGQMKTDRPEAPAKFSDDLDEATRMVRKSAPTDAAPQPSVDAPSSGHSEDPVAGWLVITDGPGRGQDFTIRYGRNSLGRAEGQSVRLDFGDTQISRDSHAILTYDPKGRAFYIQGGTGRSLTYMDGEVVLAPQPIKSGAEIQLGDTSLRFIAFVGAGFDWSDRNEQEG